MKAKTNKTLDWLLQKEPEEQGRLVRHAVKRTGQVTMTKKRRQNDTVAEVIRRFVFLPRQVTIGCQRVFTVKAVLCF